MKGECYCDLVDSIDLHRREIINANGLSELVFDSWMLGLRLAGMPAGYDQNTTRSSALRIAAWLRGLPEFTDAANGLGEVATAGITWS